MQLDAQEATIAALRREVHALRSENEHLRSETLASAASAGVGRLWCKLYGLEDERCMRCAPRMSTCAARHLPALPLPAWAELLVVCTWSICQSGAVEMLTGLALANRCFCSVAAVISAGDPAAWVPRSSITAARSVSTSSS